MVETLKICHIIRILLFFFFSQSVKIVPVFFLFFIYRIMQLIHNAEVGNTPPVTDTTQVKIAK